MSIIDSFYEDITELDKEFDYLEAIGENTDKIDDEAERLYFYYAERMQKSIKRMDNE